MPRKKKEEPVIENGLTTIDNEDIGKLSSEIEGEKNCEISPQEEESGVLAEKEPSTFDNEDVGVLSSEIENEKSFELTPQEKEIEIYKEIKEHERDNQVLWGQVYSVDRADRKSCRFFISVLFKGTKVSIPDHMYFESTFDFGRNYENKMSEEEKMKLRMAMATYQLGAKICFCVEKAMRTKILKGEFKDEYTTIVIGNRNKAMEVLRNIYFFHKGRTKSAKRAPRNVAIGDVINNAHVLAVKEDSVLIEACGIETRLDAYNLNKEFVDNCKKFVSPGDTIPVRVRKLHINKDSVYMSCSGRLDNISKMISTIKRGDVLIGVVDRYNKEKNTYTVILKNSVPASCQSYTVRQRIPLAIGDKVYVRVVEVVEDLGFVVGHATKI